MSVIYIFSYGSNMFTTRIKKRIKSYSVFDVGYIQKHKLKFHKKSKDSSGKADAYYTGRKKDIVWGVVGIINIEDKKTLDRIEGIGKGYNQKEVEVHTEDDSVIKANIYYADKNYINRELKPYNWYKQFVLEGAKENKLPNDYIDIINKTESIIDKDLVRREMNYKILYEACT